VSTPRSPRQKLAKDCEAFLVLWDDYWNTGAFEGPPWQELRDAAERIRETLEKT
jgi:hypothetical protein